jgi:hypothetical protein
MATIINLKNGSRAIQFSRDKRKRATIHLGRMTAKNALDFKRRVEALVSALKANHSPDAETSAWVGDLDDDFRDKLVRVGLAKPRADSKPVDTLGPWIERASGSRCTSSASGSATARLSRQSTTCR